MKTRTDVLNHLARKYNLKRYLEIGVQDPAQNFDKVICAEKFGVDPDPSAGASFCMTSDDFFYINNPEDKIDVTTIEDFYSTHGGRKYMTIDRRLDLIFIDGLHTAEQVAKDFKNSIKFLSPNGFIVIHDCNPEKEEHTIVPRPKPTGHWNGNVFQFAITIASPHYGYEEGYPERPVTVDVDNGCLVYRHGQWSGFGGVACLAWGWFDKHRKEYLNLISWDEFIRL